MIEHVFFDQLFKIAGFVRLAFKKRDQIAVLIGEQLKTVVFGVCLVPIVLALVLRFSLQLLFAFSCYGCIPPLNCLKYV